MKFLSNTWQKLSSMSTGKKVYAGMWALTGALMISLIGIFVGLNDKYKLSTPKDQTGWTLKTVNTDQNKGAALTIPSTADYKVTAIKAGTVKLVDGTEKTYTVGQSVSLSEAKLIEDIKVWFDLEKFDFTGKTNDMKSLYEVDEWKTVLTNEAKNAVNATAAVGALFGAALIGTVFTTVIVSVYEKRKRSGGNK